MREGGLIDIGLEMGIVKKAGAFFSMGDTRLGQGRENAKEFLRVHPEIAESIEAQIRAAMAPAVAATVPAEDDEEDAPGDEA
jgi:recombination protein RecA